MLFMFECATRCIRTYAIKLTMYSFDNFVKIKMILVDALNIQQKSSTDSKEFDVGCDLKIANNILVGNI